LRGHFENLFRVIMVTKNLYDFMAVGVPRNDTIFQSYILGRVYPESCHTNQVRLNRYIKSDFQHRDALRLGYS
jgi:hypothetical protein